MRLVCPNCGAQYEVPDEVIPTAGRDVQCSNCGDTWFQPHPDYETAPAEEEAAVSAPPPAPEPEPVPEAPIEEPAPEAETPAAPLDEELDADLEAALAADDTTEPPKRELSSSVADILREEAAFEEAARKREAETLENQPDLGLDEPSQRSTHAQDHTAQLRGETVAAAAVGTAAAATAAASRRDVLPDIEEINSTLRKDGGAQAQNADLADAAPRAMKRSGFRLGFSLILLLAVIALLVYIFAPQISEAVPALAPYLERYVLAVNEARLWLDTQMRGMLTSLDEMAGQPAPEAAEPAAASE